MKQPAVEASAESAEKKLILQVEEASAPKPARVSRNSVSASRSPKGENHQIISYRYDDKRKNNPHVGMVDTLT